MTQPAVSMQIKGLEDRYQTRLFERQGQRMVPTERAQSLIAPARELLTVAAETEKTIAGPGSRELSGRLTLAVAVEGRRLPALLTHFQRHHQAVSISAVRQPEAEALAALRGGRADLTLLGDAPASKQFESIPLLEDELVPVVPAAHPWANADGDGPLHLGEMVMHPLVLPRAGSELRYAIEEALVERGLARQDLQPSLELDSMEDVALAVEAGAGLGFVSRSRVSPAAVGVTQPFGEGDDASPIIIPHHAYLVRLRRASPSLVAAAFWRYANGELALYSIVRAVCSATAWPSHFCTR
jgi:DNA-binding transcriptional LysR family regulator